MANLDCILPTSKCIIIAFPCSCPNDNPSKFDNGQTIIWFYLRMRRGSGKEAEDDQRVPLRRSLKSAIKKGDRFSGYFPRHHHQEDDDHDKNDGDDDC